MEPTLIATIALGAVLFITLMLWWRTGRKRAAARRDSERAQKELSALTLTAASLRRGEQEAAWTASATTGRLQRALLDLDKSNHEIQRATADLAALKERAEAADRELLELRAQSSTATAKVAALEAELAIALQRAEDAATHLDELTQMRTTTQGRPATPPARLADRTDTERQALAALQSELEYAKAEAAALRAQATATPSSDSEELAQLRSEVARLSTTRPPGGDGADVTYAEWDRELRSRVGEAVDTATARLRSEVEHLRLVVAEKERIIQRGLSAPAAVPQAAPRSAPVITDIKGIGPKIAGILAEHGITTVSDVAELTEGDIERVSEVMPVYPGRIRDDDWIGQARTLLS